MSLTSQSQAEKETQVQLNSVDQLTLPTVSSSTPHSLLRLYGCFPGYVVGGSPR
jgi:hypothetical protein